MRVTPLLRFTAACGLLFLSANLLAAAEFVPLGFSYLGRLTGKYLSVSEDGSLVVGRTGRVVKNCIGGPERLA